MYYLIILDYHYMNDGLNNNMLSEYNTSEIIYKSDLNNNIHLIKLKLFNKYKYCIILLFRNIKKYW